MANKWYQRLNPFRASSEAQAANLKSLEEKAANAQAQADLGSKEARALAQQLDAVMGEFRDSMSYEAKFFDTESSNYSGGGFTELNGIDQIVNGAILGKIYTSETWVYVAVNAIAQAVAGLPVKLEKRRTVKHQVESEITGETETIEQEVWIDANGEKLAKRFQYPNPYCSKTEFITLLLIDLLTAGQYFVWLDAGDVDLTTVNYDQTSEEACTPFGRLRQLMASNTPIKAMYRIPPALMKAVPAETGFGVEVYHMESNQGSYAYNPAEIVHVKLPNPMDPFSGLSPLVPAFKPVLIDRFSTEHMIRFYKSGARLGGVIETDKGLNKEQLARFQRSFENNYTGRANHHRTLILPPGMKYSPIEQNPAQTALLDFCKYNREAVLAAYRVPPIKAGILDGSNYANARAQLRTFFKDTVVPLLGFVEDGFNLKATLIPTDQYRVKFDLSMIEELQDDGLALSNVAKGMLDSGATVNEVRKKVWRLQPIDKGDQAPVIAKIERDMVNTQIGMGLASGAGPGVSPEAEQSPKDPVQGAAEQSQEEIAQNQITDPTLSLNGSQVQALLAIVNQVGQGLLPRASGIEMIIASFSVPRDAAERIMGEVGRSFEPREQVQADSLVNLDAPTAEDLKDAPTGPGTDVKPTKISFTDRVNELVGQFVQEGIPLDQAVPKAIEQAKAEGFDPSDEPTDPDDAPPAPNSDGAGAPDQSTPPSSEAAKAEASSLDQFLRDRLAALGDQPVSPDVVSSLIAEFEAGAKAPEVKPEPTYAAGHTKESVVAEWKGFVEKTEPLVLKRASHVRAFFEKFKSLIMKRLGANVKAHGLLKARDSEDIDEILARKGELESLLKEYVAQVDHALMDAYETGFGNTLTEIKLGGPEDKEVADQLRKYLAGKISGITDTTLDQMRTLLAEKFEAGVAIGEVSKAIQEKFTEIDSGRAVTIARTETLTAVSLGREMKRREARAEYPDKIFRKMWVSAQDDHVRDSHAALDGKSVGIDEAFENGLMYPRDPGGSPEEVINCRCTDITYMEETENLVQEGLTSNPDSANQE